MQLHSITTTSPTQKQEIQPPKNNEMPTTRPIVIIGPSLKGFKVTDMMQKAVFVYLRHRFEGRIIIKHVAADISLSGNRDSSTDEIEAEMEQIKKLTTSNKLVVLDCDTINHPSQLSPNSLKPIIVYIKIKSQKVLQKLIESYGKNEIQNMDIQMTAAQKLLECPAEMFDVVLDENELDLVCEHLTTYLLAEMPMLS